MLWLAVAAAAVVAHADGEGRRCARQGDCPTGYRFRSPEEASWNACGKPHPGACPAGYISDGCGQCFRACRARRDCPKGQSCNGEYCISARRCVRPAPPPP